MTLQSEEIYPHHLHLSNKMQLQNIITQLETLDNMPKDVETDETEADSPNLIQVILALKDFKESYSKEVMGWDAMREEKHKEWSKLDVEAKKQTELIAELKEALASEQIKRHKCEHLLKELSTDNADYLAAVTTADKEVLSELAGEKSEKCYYQADTNTFVIMHDVTHEEVAKYEKLELGHHSQIEGLRGQLDQVKGQLGVEQDKVAKLQEIVEEYHREKAKAVKQKEVSMEQRSQTAPRSLASRHSSAPLMKTMGSADDFFEEMFNEPKFITISSQLLLSNGFVTSSLGNVKIDNVHKNGHFIVIRNDSPKYDEELGLYVLQQKLDGKIIASFRFPQRAKLKAGTKMNIWASGTSEARNCPPTDYIWKDQYKCAYGLECITVLCKPNGQAIAWYCGQHHYDGNLPELNDFEMLRRQSRLIPLVESQITDDKTTTQRRPFIRREQTDIQVSRKDARKHPHGFHIHEPAHPSSDTFRERVAGNDQTSLVRQTRLSRTPDLVPELYTGGVRTGMRSLYGYRTWEATPSLVPMKSSAGMIRKVSAVQAQ